jgi:uncharacterized YccA/Bax inhibitor family protein
MRTRRLGSVVGALVALVLAALVVLGMVTGIDRDFDRGTATEGTRDAQLGLGLLALALFVGSIRGAWLARSGRPSSQITLLLLGLAATLVWAFFRVSEYSS